MNWWGAGIKAVVQQRGEDPFHGERRVKERGERESSASGLCKKNISPKPLTGELKGTDYYKFLQAEELKFWSFGSEHHSLELSQLCMAVLLGKKRAEDLEQQSGMGSPWVTMGENSPLPGVHLQEDILSFQVQKTLWAPLNSYSLPGDRGTCRGQITHASAFLGWSSTRHSTLRLSSSGGRPVCTMLAPLNIWSFESQLCTRDKT